MQKREGDSDNIDVDKMRNNDIQKGFIIRYELLAVIFALVIQTITAVQWGATVTTKLEYTQSAIVELKQEIKNRIDDIFTKADADREFSVVYKRLERLENNAVVK
jgi:hypothetical protein